jgi:hypothetical protein
VNGLGRTWDARRRAGNLPGRDPAGGRVPSQHGLGGVCLTKSFCNPGASIGALSGREREMDHLEFDLLELREADAVAFTEPGCTDMSDQAARVYESVKAGRSPQLPPRLERLLDGATAAGRVYAATLLGLIDPEAGRDAWDRLADDDSPLEICRGGVTVRRTTVAEYVAEQHVTKPAR